MSLTPAGIERFVRILFIREYLDGDKYLKGRIASDPSPLDPESVDSVKDEKWTDAIDRYLGLLSDPDKQALIDLFGLTDGAGAALTPDALRGRHIATILSDKKTARDLLAAVKTVEASTITDKGKVIAILFLREYLDLDKLLKDRPTASSPLDEPGIVQVKDEKWTDAIDTYLAALSDPDKQAFIDLFGLTDGAGAALTPDALRARHISSQILTQKAGPFDFIGAVCRLDGTVDFCPAITASQAEEHPLGAAVVIRANLEVSQGTTAANNIYIKITGVNLPEVITETQIAFLTTGGGATVDPKVTVVPGSITQNSDGTEMVFAVAVTADADIGGRDIQITSEDGYLIALTPEAARISITSTITGVTATPQVLPPRSSTHVSVQPNPELAPGVRYDGLVAENPTSVTPCSSLPPNSIFTGVTFLRHENYSTTKRPIVIPDGTPPQKAEFCVNDPSGNPIPGATFTLEVPAMTLDRRYSNPTEEVLGEMQPHMEVSVGASGMSLDREGTPSNQAVAEFLAEVPNYRLKAGVGWQILGRQEPEKGAYATWKSDRVDLDLDVDVAVQGRFTPTEIAGRSLDPTQATSWDIDAALSAVITAAEWADVQVSAAYSFTDRKIAVPSLQYPSGRRHDLTLRLAADLGDKDRKVISVTPFADMTLTSEEYYFRTVGYYPGASPLGSNYQVGMGLDVQLNLGPVSLLANYRYHTGERTVPEAVFYPSETRTPEDVRHTSVGLAGHDFRFGVRLFDLVEPYYALRTAVLGGNYAAGPIGHAVGALVTNPEVAGSFELELAFGGDNNLFYNDDIHALPLTQTDNRFSLRYELPDVAERFLGVNFSTTRFYDRAPNYAADRSGAPAGHGYAWEVGLTLDPFALARLIGGEKQVVPSTTASNPSHSRPTPSLPYFKKKD
ncbi:MAG: hypothetical protein ABH823_05095 [bacterium]